MFWQNALKTTIGLMIIEEVGTKILEAVIDGL